MQSNQTEALANVRIPRVSVSCCSPSVQASASKSGHTFAIVWQRRCRCDASTVSSLVLLARFDHFACMALSLTGHCSSQQNHSQSSGLPEHLRLHAEARCPFRAGGNIQKKTGGSKRWSEAEDAALLDAVHSHQRGAADPHSIPWETVAAAVGSRSARQCQEHYRGVSSPEINHGGWTDEEEWQLACLHCAHASSWTLIASHLPGRPPNVVKNKFNSLVVRAHAPCWLGLLPHAHHVCMPRLCPECLLAAYCRGQPARKRWDRANVHGVARAGAFNAARGVQRRKKPPRSRLAAYVAHLPGGNKAGADAPHRQAALHFAQGLHQKRESSNKLAAADADTDSAPQSAPAGKPRAAPADSTQASSSADAAPASLAPRSALPALSQAWAHTQPPADMAPQYAWHAATMQACAGVALPQVHPLMGPFGALQHKHGSGWRADWGMPAWRTAHAAQYPLDGALQHAARLQDPFAAQQQPQPQMPAQVRCHVRLSRVTGKLLHPGYVSCCCLSAGIRAARVHAYLK